MSGFQTITATSERTISMSEKIKYKLTDDEVETVIDALRDAATLYRMLTQIGRLGGEGASVDAPYCAYMADRYQALADLADSVDVAGMTVRYTAPSWAGV